MKTVRQRIENMDEECTKDLTRSNNRITPLSISFLTLSSNQIMSHVQFEMFCSEVLPYPYSEISK